MKFFTFILPLVIYFIADWLWGLGVAVALSMLFPLFFIARTGIKEQRLDKEAISDLCLILIFGALDLIGYPQLVLPSTIIVLMLLSLCNVVDLYSLSGGEQIKVLMRNPYAKKNMREGQARVMAWAFVALAFAIYTSVSPESALTQWINEWGIATILIVYIASEIIVGRYKYYKYRKVEWVPLMTEEGKVVGACPRPFVHNGSHWLHPVVHLHVFNGNEILLQLRPLTKKIQPGKWDTAVGGHIANKEQIKDALQREVWEEIGLRNFEAKLVKNYVWNCEAESEYVFSFMTNASGPFETKNVGEVDELKFWSLSEIEMGIEQNIFTPNLVYELEQWIIPLLKETKK